MPEDLSPAIIGNRHLGERIARVEDLVKDILASQPSSTTSPVDGQARQDRRHSNPDTRQRAHVDVLYAPSPTRAPLTPTESLLESTPRSSLLVLDAQGVSGQAESERTARHHLWAAFPANEDVRILLRESSRSSLYTSLINTQPRSKLTLETLAPPYPIAELPSPSSHPVILAKCMLMFAITLQSPAGEAFLGQISEPPSVLGRRLVEAATTWVTTKEEMHGTIEGLVCIILEGVFKINCGNLRQAWAVYRRAMTVAQIMGLHRSHTPPLQRIEPAFVANPEFLWFRIVYMDRYLSLLLGLPQGTSDKSMGAMSVLRHEPPLGRFERQLTVVASRILERNEIAFASSEIATTQSIDMELLRVSKSMPASFWRPVSFQNLTPGSPENLLEVVRLGAQVYYYGLLIQLHLPYMMRRTGENGDHEYSKITCVNASREILTRFITHRSFRPMSFCSRPVDFFALLASMTLLLTHLDAHNRPATNVLAHQRLSDRAILGQALEKMDGISDVSNDVVTEQSAKLVRRLLDIEADAAEGSSYTARSVGGDEDNTQEDMEKEGGELRMHIPYLGVIKIARQSLITREQPSLANAASPPPPQTPRVDFSHTASTLVSSSDVCPTLPNGSPAAEQQQPFNHLHGMAQKSTACSGYLPASERPSVQYDEQSTYAQQESDPTQNNITVESYSCLPGIMASVDEWAFQGVDAAFFDSLMRGDVL
ncbi:hypothetical protein V494_06576 [Pseudogymnoascus sp. VKM F-4513 (FW-928)]|nr:hypothetical protein V494_06576 [Pseudogymnoascus sp. VKM F-4513 (FW-928)]